MQRLEQSDRRHRSCSNFEYYNLFDRGSEPGVADGRISQDEVLKPGQCLRDQAFLRGNQSFQSASIHDRREMHLDLSTSTNPCQYNYEIVEAAGFQTAYTDKHPEYDMVRGPSGTSQKSGVSITPT
jgi:hypothetical protein